MTKLILISGLIGAGKTTVAKSIYTMLADVALIQADKMVDYEPFIIDARLLRIKMRNCCALIDTYSDEGVKNIICEGFVQNQFELDQVEERFGSKMEISLFWLKLDRSIREERVRNRGQGTDDEPEFLDAQEASNTEPWPFVSSTATLCEIDVADKSVSDIVTLILAEL